MSDTRRFAKVRAPDQHSTPIFGRHLLLDKHHRKKSSSIFSPAFNSTIPAHNLCDMIMGSSYHFARAARDVIAIAAQDRRRSLQRIDGPKNPCRALVAEAAGRPRA